MSIRLTTSVLARNLRTSVPRLSQIRSQFIHPSLAGTMASLPKIMKGVLIEKTGGVEVLEYKTDLPVPSPKEGEILVKNDFIGINYIDTSVSNSFPQTPNTN